MANLFEISAKAVVVVGREQLMLARWSYTGDLFWDAPGGRVENKGLVETIERELAEELGWEVTLDKELEIIKASIWKSPTTEHEDKIMIYHRVDLEEKLPITLSDEHDRYVWIDPADIDSIVTDHPDVRWEHNVPLID